eukprot:SAG11_NODE_126_length_15729_cov_9.966859_4_plen_97_part_00
MEPEPPADDPDAVVAAAGDAADGDEDEGELEEEELRPATKRGGRKTAAAPKGKGGTGGKAVRWNQHNSPPPRRAFHPLGLPSPCFGGDKSRARIPA